MTNKRPLLIAVSVVTLAAGWYLFRPELLFVDRTVNDAPPAASGMRTDLRSMSAAPLPPSVIAEGRFVTGAHETTGTAAIHRTADGRSVLRLTGFSTSNGPDVRVYLVAAGVVEDAKGVKRAGFIDLGALKGNLGDQNYEIPAGTDLMRYRAVSIFCRRFAVNFGAASLRPAAPL